MSDEIRIAAAFAPASVGNLGPGYDVLGAAVEQPGDRVVARRADAGEAGHHHPGEPGADLPPCDDDNTAAVAARLTLERLGVEWGVTLELHKGLPLGSGLGSSGASAVAAAWAVNLLAGAPLAPAELVGPCAAAEAAACGSPHADNVAPSLMGGVTLVRGLDDVSRVNTGLDLWLTLVTPALSLSTRDARQAIPARIPVQEAVHNCAHAATIVHALCTDDAELLSRAISDRVAEPRRAGLIPGFRQVQAAALSAGALGSSISGAGPTTFALCLGEQRARAARDAMTSALDSLGMAYKVIVSPIAKVGAREVEP